MLILLAAAHPSALVAAARPLRASPSCLLSSSAEGWGRLEGVATTARAFMDVSIDGAPAGRLEFDLFGDVAPRTVENFRCLCTGERGVGEQGKPLHYEVREVELEPARRFPCSFTAHRCRDVSSIGSSPRASARPATSSTARARAGRAYTA